MTKYNPIPNKSAANKIADTNVQTESSSLPNILTKTYAVIIYLDISNIHFPSSSIILLSFYTSDCKSTKKKWNERIFIKKKTFLEV